MDHAYLEATVSPVLVEAIAKVTLMLANSYQPSEDGQLTQIHPHIDPIEYIGKYLLLSERKDDHAVARELEMQYQARDAMLARAYEEELTRKHLAEASARAAALEGTNNATPAGDSAAVDQLPGGAGAPANADGEATKAPEQAAPADGAGIPSSGVSTAPSAVQEPAQDGDPQ